jgi:nickel-dependent lactate racemase
VTSGYPYDTDLYQAVRAVEYADAVVRPGGSILLASPCKDGVGGQEFYDLMKDAYKKPNDFLRDIIRRNGKVTFGVLGYTLSRIKTEKRLLIVTDGIPSNELIAMGFRPVDSLQAGIDILLEEYGRDAQVIVFPEGSSTIPVTTDG